MLRAVALGDNARGEIYQASSAIVTAMHSDDDLESPTLHAYSRCTGVKYGSSRNLPINNVMDGGADINALPRCTSRGSRLYGWNERDLQAEKAQEEILQRALSIFCYLGRHGQLLFCFIFPLLPDVIKSSPPCSCSARPIPSLRSRMPSSLMVGGRPPTPADDDGVDAGAEGGADGVLLG